MPDREQFRARTEEIAEAHRAVPVSAGELKPFCAAADNIRYYLREPWTRDGFTWATNGHIIVRVPAIDGVPENDKAPNALKVLDGTEAPLYWIPVPVIPLPTFEDCDTCRGDGTHECSCGKEHECGDCGGAGNIEKTTYTDVGEVRFADKYLRLIQGWEIAPNGPEGPAWIRNGDALGLLMPVKK